LPVTGYAHGGDQDRCTFLEKPRALTFTVGNLINAVQNEATLWDASINALEK